MLEPDDGKFTCATINTLIDEAKVCDGIVDCKRDLSDEIGIGKLAFSTNLVAENNLVFKNNFVRFGKKMYYSTVTPTKIV